MAGTYDPASLGVKAPSGGFQEGGWYQGRQYWGGTLSDPGVIHPSSNQQGAGQAVSAEVNAQSAAQQGTTAKQFEEYLQKQRETQAAMQVKPASTYTPSETPRSMQSGSSAGGAGIPGGVNPVPVIDLAATFKKLTEESGVANVQAELDAKTKAYNDALNKINDNPYYSEATRVGRAEKLRQNFENEASRLSNAVAAKKADVEMQLNLQTKQFDINSTAAQTALNQFNSLLEMGALDGASNEDIANITKTTGLSSGLIQSAIQAKKIAGYTTTTQTFDDGTSEGFVIYTVDPQGNIVNQVKQITGTSSKAQSQFSSDPFISNYLKGIIEGIIESNAGKTSTKNIESIWGDTKTTSQSNQTFRNVA